MPSNRFARAASVRMWIDGPGRQDTDTGTVWSSWTSNSLTYSTSAGSGTGQVWISWNTSSSTSATTITNDTWIRWNNEWKGSAQPTRHVIQPSAEEVAHRAAQAELARQRRAIEDAERQAAKERAELLLRGTLSEHQIEQLNQRNYFELETVRQDGERRKYRINRGRVRNVQQIGDDGRVIKTLCAHPSEHVPDADTMLAQKLWLEVSEDEFLRVANHS